MLCARGTLLFPSHPREKPRGRPGPRAPAGVDGDARPEAANATCAQRSTHGQCSLRPARVSGMNTRISRLVAWLVIDERARVIVDAATSLADLVSATDSLERARGATLLANALLELARSVLTDPASWPPACPALTHRPPCLHHPPHGGEQISDDQAGAFTGSGRARPCRGRG